MAKLYDPRNHKRQGSALRPIVVAAFLLVVLLPAAWLLYLPLMQIYWATYARLMPMRSDVIIEDRDTVFFIPHSQKTAQNMEVTSPSTTAEEEADDGVSALAKQYRLTKEKAIRMAKSSNGKTAPLVVTWANFHYKDFVMNWVEHLQATGCKNYLVGAMDDELLQHLIDAKVPTFSMSSGLTLGDFGWGSPTFNKMGREKISLIQTFVHWGVEVVISDVDTVWLRDPTEFALQYPDVDVLSSSDHLSATSTDGGLENEGGVYSAANIGIMLFRPKAVDLVDEWVDILDRDASVWDQNAFNDLIKRGLKHPPPGERIFLGYNETLRYGVLPVSLFCSGHTFFTQGMPMTLGLKPYVVHATFQYSGTPGKRNRFREHLMWNDPPSYFEHPVGFLALEDKPSQELLKAAADFSRDGTLEGAMPHFQLIHSQFLSLRAQFAIATILGRAVVLPQIWCGQDRWWAPHSGVIPGSEFTLPFPCPADHVLDLESMSNKDLSEEEFGPYIEWRESSFLDNERAKKLVSQPSLTLKVCAPSEVDESCSDGSAPAQITGDGKTIKLRPKLNEVQLRTALSEVDMKKYKIIYMQGAAEIWGGWSDSTAGNKFKKRIDKYGAIFCCVQGHPGHVWYDFYWDTIPHVDRHGREIAGAWEPQKGP